MNLAVTGSTLSFSENGVVRITASDTQLDRGVPAVMTFGAPQGDNWVGVGTNSSAPTFRVGGTVSGLSGTVVLENNGANDLRHQRQRARSPSAPRWPRAPPTTSPSRPTPSGQTCTVTNPSGTVAAAQRHQRLGHLCDPDGPHLLRVWGHRPPGLSGTVVLENNGANDLSTSANGALAFSTPLVQGAAYNVTVKTNPSKRTCTVTNPARAPRPRPTSPTSRSPV